MASQARMTTSAPSERRPTSSSSSSSFSSSSSSSSSSPPRASASTLAPPLPAYSSSAADAQRSGLVSEQWRSRDPRSSSTHSLVPSASESERDGRRTLLLVFIHGFMGSETTFRSFPAHVHNLLTITLAETHVVHTKIYPRYESRKDISFASDDFSRWLEPHEDHATDVVLLGHSMGGLLSAEVVLQKPPSPVDGRPFRHRILGTVNFDTPFLGMHPGVVLSGIASLFRPAPEPPAAWQAQSVGTGGSATPSIYSQASGSSQSYASSSSTLSLIQSITSPDVHPPPNDPFFNPPFANDVRLPERKGWANFLHFVSKHSSGLANATKEYLTSHLEFGGCLADYPGLKNRYERIRTLEDVNDLVPPASHGDQAPQRPRVRFVNYYTASTGRPKHHKIPPPEHVPDGTLLRGIERDSSDMSLRNTGFLTPNLSTPRISIEWHDEGTVTPQPLGAGLEGPLTEAQMKYLGENFKAQNDVQEELAPMQHFDSRPHIDSRPMEDEVDLCGAPTEPLAPAVIQDAIEEPSLETKSGITGLALPPAPPRPAEPEAIDLAANTDKDSRQIAETKQERVPRAYQQAVKGRHSAFKDIQKLLEKEEKRYRQAREKEERAQERRIRHEREKEAKAEEKRLLSEGKAEKKRLAEEKKRVAEEAKRMATLHPESRRERRLSVSSVSSTGKDVKPKRDKKFCMLPHQREGKPDECWVRVYMEGVDEVGAHCGLFFPGPHYQSLVGDVGERIEQWVADDAHRRTVQGV